MGFKYTNPGILASRIQEKEFRIKPFKILQYKSNQTKKSKCVQPYAFTMFSSNIEISRWNGFTLQPTNTEIGTELHILTKNWNGTMAFIPRTRKAKYAIY